MKARPASASHSTSSDGAAAPELVLQGKRWADLLALVSSKDGRASDDSRGEQRLHELRHKVGVLRQHAGRQARDDLGRRVDCRRTRVVSTPKVASLLDR